MWLLVYAPAVFGVLRHRHWPYWRWVVGMLIWQSAAQFLFDGRGSLEHPERDGLIMRAVRQATNDGPEVLLVGIPFLIVFWGGLIYVARKLYLESKAPDLGATSVKPASGLRKGVELAVLTAATGAMLYANFTAPAEPNVTPTSEPEAVAAPIDTVIDHRIAELNAVAPYTVDKITVLTGASRQGRVLIYDYKISDARVTREAMAAYLQDGPAKSFCAFPEDRRLLNGGATLRLRYALAAGGSPVSRDITDLDCPAS